MTIQLETTRLRLRAWQDCDLNPFYDMSQDAEVMQYFPQLLDRTASQKLALKIQTYIEQQGWGFWALELKATGEFIGFTGLHHQPTQFDFSPCTEIGWRLKRSAWGKGYAFEAASASLHFGFNTLKLNQIVAFTACLNYPSESLMKRLGMSKVQTFQHPDLPDAHPLKAHVLYAMHIEDFSPDKQR